MELGARLYLSIVSYYTSGWLVVYVDQIEAVPECHVICT